MSKGSVGWVVFGLVLAWSTSLAAHEFRPATLMLQEIAHGRFRVDYAAPVLSYEYRAKIEPSFPAHCRVEPGVLDCGERGLVGEVQFPGLEGSTQRVFFRVHWLNGSERTLILRGGESARFEGSGKSHSAWAVARQYLELGVEHILSGIDHLLFVLGLMLLVRERRRLVLTVTAFTLAHSVTLALATLGLASVPQPPVEAAIALSILLLAVECAEPRPSFTRRRPWLVAFGFGLLHGFGFAGALREVGLPETRVPEALLFFNLGVELGQLLVISVVWGLAMAASRWHRRLERPARALVYVMGTAAAYWSIERVSAVLGLPFG